MSAREPSQKAKISTAPALRGISIYELSRRSVRSQEDLSNSSDIHRSVLLSPTASPRSRHGPRLSHRSSEGKCYQIKRKKALTRPLVVEDKGKKLPQSSPTARLPHLFRFSPTLPPLITRCHSRNSLPSTRAVPIHHRTDSHPIHQAFPGELREHGYDCPLADHYFPLGYRSPLDIPSLKPFLRHGIALLCLPFTFSRIRSTSSVTLSFRRLLPSFPSFLNIYLLPEGRCLSPAFSVTEAETTYSLSYTSNEY